MTNHRNDSKEIQTHKKCIIDKRVHIDSIKTVNIDTALNLFNENPLIGITIKGHIDKSIKDTISKAIDYIDKLICNEKIVYYKHKISINIIPTIDTIEKSKLPRTSTKYNYLADRTEFEFYFVSKTMPPSSGHYKFHITCGQQRQKIVVMIRK
ncbi:MAG TPA: hypothetical protein PKW80_05910 [Bacteroidales bacterium]|nr:hypothetical protein [Bacteroidales bacterium]